MDTGPATRLSSAADPGAPPETSMKGPGAEGGWGLRVHTGGRGAPCSLTWTAGRRGSSSPRACPGRSGALTRRWAAPRGTGPCPAAAASAEATSDFCSPRTQSPPGRPGPAADGGGRGGGCGQAPGPCLPGERGRGAGQGRPALAGGRALPRSGPRQPSRPVSPGLAPALSGDPNPEGHVLAQAGCCLPPLLASLADLGPPLGLGDPDSCARGRARPPWLLKPSGGGRRGGYGETPPQPIQSSQWPGDMGAGGALGLRFL